MPFYRQGGSTTRQSRMYDEVFADFIGGATGWLPVTTGTQIGVNICRARINYQSAVQSEVSRSPIAPEVQVILEMKATGDGDPYPVDQWQNLTVAAMRKANRNGWVRLRIVNINNTDGDGVSMAMMLGG